MSAFSYRLLWLEVAERQYLSLPDGDRALVDQGLALLQDDPTGWSGAVYDPGSDQWSTTLAAGAWCSTPSSPSRRP